MTSAAGAPPSARPALFLDRDGVINLDHGYVGRIEDFDFVPGIFDLARFARSLGLPLIVVTNQSGIARGLYDEADFEKLTRHMRQCFIEEGAPLAAVYYCPTHPEATVERYRRVDGRRKPGPGMIIEAAADHHLDLAGSAMIGDQWSDAEAAAAAGIGHVALVGAPRGAVPAPAPAATLLSAVADAPSWLGAAIATSRPGAG